MAQVMDATEAVSSKSNPMLRLDHAILPSRHVVTDFLVFVDNCFWKIRDFCTSAVLQLLAHQSEVNFEVGDCLSRVCFVALDCEEGPDNKRRLKVKKYLSKEEAIKRNPALSEITPPRNAPGPKKLTPVSTERDTSRLAQAGKRAIAV